LVLYLVLTYHRGIDLVLTYHRGIDLVLTYHRGIDLVLTYHRDINFIIAAHTYHLAEKNSKINELVELYHPKFKNGQS